MTSSNRELQGDHVPIWLVIGDAGPLVEEAAAEIEASAVARCGLPAFNHGVFRASEPGAVEAFAAARTLPMMADLRVVVVRGVEEGSDAFYEALVDYAAEPSPTTVLLLTGSGFPKVAKGGKNWASRVGNALKKHGRIVKRSAQDASPVRYVQQCAERLGKRLERRDAEILVELVGADLGRLRQEVGKVALFVGDSPEITAADLQQACSLVAEGVIWDLTTGIAARDVDRALTALHRQLEEGDDPRKLLGMIVWQLRTLLEGAALLQRGVPEHEVRNRTRLRPDALQRLAQSVRKAPPDPARMMARIARANRDMNLHRAGARHVLEALVLELCSTPA